MNNTLRYSLILFMLISGVNFLVNFLINLIGRTYGFDPFWRLCLIVLASVISGLVTTLIVISTAPVLKNYITTIRQLLRLDTLSHPLLLKLQQAAPSTFQHSLQVANLAHRAAKAIGANAFLTRIGGYYHDIGKIKDADFFIENRREGQPEPEHETAYQKFARIKEHINEGVRLAEENKLPPEVVAFIPEHHGTLLSEFMYELAKTEGPVKKSDFRYGGPKPQTKETALLMLADAIESKMRTLEEFDKEHITEVVDSIIDSRVEDKQLDYSGLTKGDIQAVRKAFIEGSQINYHQRIKYPDQNKKKK